MAASSPFTRWRTRGYTRFCFVRHPFERFGSTHRFLLRRGKPVPADINEYAALLADGDPSVVKRNLLQWHYAEHVDFVGRFERLGQDFDEICRRVGISARLDHYNSSGDKISYTRDFTARTVGNLGDYFKEDFERLGYIASLTQPERSP